MKPETAILARDLRPCFPDLKASHVEFLAECAFPMHFVREERFVRHGEPADAFYLIRTGLVALEITAGNRHITVQTIPEDELLGWSWLVPPYRWRFDARALTDVNCIQFNALRVREHCEADTAFGYEIYKRFSLIIAERLVATRIQVSEIYR